MRPIQAKSLVNKGLFVRQPLRQYRSSTSPYSHCLNKFFLAESRVVDEEYAVVEARPFFVSVAFGWFHVTMSEGTLLMFRS